MRSLEAEKAEFLKDLSLSDSTTNQTKDEGNIDRLTQLCNERGQYKKSNVT